MKRLYLIAALLMLVTSAFGQKETRKVGEFDGISLGIAADVYLSQGSPAKLVLEGDQDDLEDVITELRGSTLVIKYKNSRGWNFRMDKIDIYITTPEINEISLGGSGMVRGETPISSDDLELEVSGSGKIRLQVSADRLTQRISGSGNIELSGEADSADVGISGSGSLNAEDLSVDHYNIRISGSGKCRIHAGDSIEANISGSGSVYYTGDPDRIISNVSGSGKVRKL